MGNVIVQSEAQRLTEECKTRIDLGDDSYSIADALGINRDGVREIILQRKSRLCELCEGKGKRQDKGKDKICGGCDGLGAQD